VNGHPEPASGDHDPRKRSIARVLFGLFLFDGALVIWAGLFPDLWFLAFHGVPYVDPQGFLRRCAANWAAFALCQLVAFRRFRTDPGWILIVAGARLSDIFTDWTYLAFSQDRTWFAWLGLGVTSPANLWLGLWLKQRYAELRVQPP
jgi:hypothetical protein